MPDREFFIERIGFLKGAMATIELYAVWRDGEQFVGCMETPLKDVLSPYMDELSRVEKQLKGD